MKTLFSAWNPPQLLFGAEGTGPHEWLAFY
jgi:hypothetical protein